MFTSSAEKVAKFETIETVSATRVLHFEWFKLIAEKNYSVDDRRSHERCLSSRERKAPASERPGFGSGPDLNISGAHKCEDHQP